MSCLTAPVDLFHTVCLRCDPPPSGSIVLMHFHNSMERLAGSMKVKISRLPFRVPKFFVRKNSGEKLRLQQSQLVLVNAFKKIHFSSLGENKDWRSRFMCLNNLRRMMKTEILFLISRMMLPCSVTSCTTHPECSHC